MFLHLHLLFFARCSINYKLQSVTFSLSVSSSGLLAVVAQAQLLSILALVERFANEYQQERVKEIEIHSVCFSFWVCAGAGVRVVASGFGVAGGRMARCHEGWMAGEPSELHAVSETQKGNLYANGGKNSTVAAT